VTDRNQCESNTLGQTPSRALYRLLLPLLVVGAALAGSGCFQHASSSDSGATTAPVPPDAAAPRSAVPAQLGQDDPRLDMNAVAGRWPTDGPADAIQVLPDGNVPDGSMSFQALDNLISTPIVIPTRWVKNPAATILWSGPNAEATQFTQLPQASYLKVVGPQEGARLAVNYVGDGVLRRPVNGWVDVDSVETVDAPPPGQVSAVDADAKQPLPVWVQAHKSTALWSGPDDRAVTLTDLPQWTFLKVAGLDRSGRLLVNFAGDYASRQPGIGWVDETAIGPAGDPGRWLTNHRATALWSGVDDKAVRLTDVPQWTKMRIVEGAAADTNRLQVEFFGDGLTRQPGLAWVLRADVGPITPPVPLPLPAAVTASVTPRRETRTFATGSEFIDAVGPAAQRSFRSTGVPASVTVAQAILESDWGRSRLSRQGNNLFGIKALGSVTGPAGVVTLATWEHVGGRDVVVQAPFKAYFTLEQSIDDHGTFFTRNRRYAAALALRDDARAFARAIQDAGYATDPSYASKLIGLMDRYDLYRFDK
jgi:hypothetical protein